ncbi:hypothetical protein [Alicyclobacillus sp. ALC3]|uniref:hypothetical protein n=1 Tax=Alicyclobacillus sp. ALC3 TaxID=2796143 RepID=UPI002378A420|nr:hypothetical protein [Alicyclobacillus sp. ALC3]WDL96957.1 hypothetical protein JC200_22205 [Alicyclobacillus sp. ALC3]
MAEEQTFLQEDINIAHEVGRLRGDVNGLLGWKTVFENRIDESIQKLHGRVDAVDANVDRKFDDMHDYINERMDGLHVKFDMVIESNEKAASAALKRAEEEAAKAEAEAANRLPKWSKWFIGILITCVLTTAGWVVDAAIHAHL